MLGNGSKTEALWCRVRAGEKSCTSGKVSSGCLSVSTDIWLLFVAHLKHWVRLYYCYFQQKQLFYGPLSGTTRVSQYQKKHLPTHHPDRHTVFISFFHLPWSIASSLFKLHAWQSFSTTSFHDLFGLPLGLQPPPHIPYISSPNQCLLFAAHAHTIATCFAVVSVLYHLFLIFLSTPYLELCFLPWHYTSIWPFSSLQCTVDLISLVLWSYPRLNWVSQ